MRVGGRTRNLTVAGGLAVAAAVLTVVGLTRGGGADAAVRQTNVPQTPVLVATADLPMGTPLQLALAKKAIVVAAVPRTSLQPAAVQTTAGLEGDVLIQPVYEGQQLLAKQIGTAAAQGLPSELSGKMRLLQVPGDANQLLEGTLQAGQTVDVVTTNRSGAVAGYALRKILVARPASAATPSVQLELTDAQAQKMFFVLKKEQWTLVLRPAAKPRASSVKPTSESNLLAKG